MQVSTALTQATIYERCDGDIHFSKWRTNNGDLWQRLEDTLSGTFHCSKHLTITTILLHLLIRPSSPVYA